MFSMMFSFFNWYWRRLRTLIPGADFYIPEADNSPTTIIIQQTASSSTSPFDRLPRDFVLKIFGNLCIGDRVRMRLVCKSWRDTLVRAEFPVKREPPWLILSNDSYDEPEYFSTEIWLESMSEERIYSFKLPDSVSSGGWRWCCCGSSNTGWLLMAGQPARRDLSSTTMMLWDPISGTTKRLPALSTLPFFGELVDDCISMGLENISSSVVTARAQVFSVGSVECVVAVVFVLGRSLNPKQHRLALCSQHDESWSIVQGGGPDEYYKDILFHNGKLYTVLAVRATTTGTTTRSLPIFKITQCTVRLSCCDVEVIMSDIMYEDQHYVGDYDDVLEVGDLHVGFNIRERWKVAEHLVGSSTTGELLVVSAILDMCSYKDNLGGHGPIPSYACSQTRGFEVRRLDVNVTNGLCSFERLSHIGEQCIFVGASGSTSIEGVEAPNCIHFATNDPRGTIGIEEKRYYIVDDDDDDDAADDVDDDAAFHDDRVVEEEEARGGFINNEEDKDEEIDPDKLYVVHERGVFYLILNRVSRKAET